jgi:AcrR family transcriptional regulator
MNSKSETSQKIVDVAINLFASKGFKGTSIRDIAKTADTTVSNIYYYFGNKEGLLLAILKHSTRRIVDELRQVTESDLEPVERFKLLVRTHFYLLIDVYRKESKILFLDEEHLVRVSKDFQMEILNMYRMELQNLKSSGYINYSNFTILAFHIIGVINWHLRWHKPDGRMSLEQIYGEMSTFVFQALGICHPEPV